MDLNLMTSNAIFLLHDARYSHLSPFCLCGILGLLKVMSSVEVAVYMARA